MKIVKKIIAAILILFGVFALIGHAYDYYSDHSIDVNRAAHVPKFKLKTIEGKTFTNEDFDNQPTLVTLFGENDYQVLRVAEAVKWFRPNVRQVLISRSSRATKKSIKKLFKRVGIKYRDVVVANPDLSWKFSASSTFLINNGMFGLTHSGRSRDQADFMYQVDRLLELADRAQKVAK